MNSLFGGFDLSIGTKPKVTPDVIIKKSAPSVIATPATPKLTNQSLFSGEGLEDFNIELNKPKVKTLLDKIANSEEGEVDATKILKSKKVSLAEKLVLIKNKVLEVLGIPFGFLLFRGHLATYHYGIFLHL